MEVPGLSPRGGVARHGFSDRGVGDSLGSAVMARPGYIRARLLRLGETLRRPPLAQWIKGVVKTPLPRSRVHAGPRHPIIRSRCRVAGQSGGPDAEPCSCLGTCWFALTRRQRRIPELSPGSVFGPGLNFLLYAGCCARRLPTGRRHGRARSARRPWLGGVVGEAGAPVFLDCPDRVVEAPGAVDCGCADRG